MKTSTVLLPNGVNLILILFYDFHNMNEMITLKEKLGRDGRREGGVGEDDEYCHHRHQRILWKPIGPIPNKEFQEKLQVKKAFIRHGLQNQN